jgi:signal transduction histidine kinase
MLERAELVGGSLSVSSTPGHGTVVVLEVTSG